MDKELFADLMQSMKDAVDIGKGELPPSRLFTVAPPDVKQVREKTGLSQKSFAQMIGVRAPDVAIKALHAAPGDQVS